MLSLLTKVTAFLPPEAGRTELRRVRDAVVVGRTLEADPRYDLRLPNGEIVSNVPADKVRIG